MNDTHIGGMVGVPVIETPLLPRNRAVMVGGQLHTGDKGALIHRLIMDAIKWQMRIDLARMLDAFAARMGVTRQ